MAEITLSWDKHPDRAEWSRLLMQVVGDNLALLEKVRPDEFIDGYSALEPDNKKRYWSELIIAIARFESDRNPHSIYHEKPPLDVDSVGLLQLSYQDEVTYHLEPLDRSAKS